MTGATSISNIDPPARLPIACTAAFDRYGNLTEDALPFSPIVISVPHSGRDYPATLLAQSRVMPAMLRRLEDRYADVLAHRLIAHGHAVIVARTARAVIDLNRDEREIDPVMVRDVPHGTVMIASAKLRGGLGLIPRRLHGANELWRGPLEWADVRQRIEQVHRPYHGALAQMMARARDAHGYAILIDIHSMPPLLPTGDQPAPGIVLGDRFGRSASGRLIARAADILHGRGIIVTQNHPYPGNYLIDRHGRPDHDLHALQIEIDRTLYLDDALDRPGIGVATVQALLLDLANALADEWPVPAFAQAAE